MQGFRVFVDISMWSEFDVVYIYKKRGEVILQKYVTDFCHFKYIAYMGYTISWQATCWFIRSKSPKSKPTTWNSCMSLLERPLSNIDITKQFLFFLYYNTHLSRSGGGRGWTTILCAFSIDTMINAKLTCVDVSDFWYQRRQSQTIRTTCIKYVKVSLMTKRLIVVSQ